MLEYFEYKKADGSVSDRVAIVLSKPIENVMMLDVTEFSKEEQALYSEAVEEAQLMFKETIKNLGLGSQYRYFKKEGISYAES